MANEEKPPGWPVWLLGLVLLVLMVAFLATYQSGGGH